MTKFFWEGVEIYSSAKRKTIALEEAKKYCVENHINHWELVSNAKNKRIVNQRIELARHMYKLGFGYQYIGHAINKDHSCVGNYLRDKTPSIEKYDFPDNVIKVDGEQVAVLNYFTVLPHHYKKQFCNQFAKKYNIDASGIKISYENARKDLPKWTPELKK